MKNSILLFLATVVSLTAYGADTKPSVYDANAKTMTIQTPDNLTWLATQVNNENSYEGWTITLGRDLDMSEESFTPIGASKKTFDGTFDGNGHCISHFNTGTGSYRGLFGNVGESGIVKNVVVDNTCTINGSSLSGGIAGSNSGTILNCINKANVSTSAQTCGGIVGTNKGTVSGCINYGNITGSKNVGGIAGTSTHRIENCTNYGSITAIIEAVGGIIGNLTNTSTYVTYLSNCFTSGNINLTNPTGDYYAGAIIGIKGRPFSVTNCYYASEVIVKVKDNTYTCESPEGCGIGRATSPADSYDDATVYFSTTIPAKLVGDFGWATYYNSAANMLADEGTTVYTAKLSTDGETLVLTEVADRIVKKGQGVILKRSGEDDFLLTATATAANDSYFTSNVLTGVDASTAQATGQDYFVLGTGKKGLGFYKLTSTTDLGSHKAFVVLTEGNSVRAMLLDDSQTAAIGHVTATKATQPNTYTDLLGRKVATPRKGIYMVNGKKTVVR